MVTYTFSFDIQTHVNDTGFSKIITKINNTSGEWYSY